MNSSGRGLSETIIPGCTGRAVRKQPYHISCLANSELRLLVEVQKSELEPDTVQNHGLLAK